VSECGIQHQKNQQSSVAMLHLYTTQMHRLLRVPIDRWKRIQAAEQMYVVCSRGGARNESTEVPDKYRPCTSIFDTFLSLSLSLSNVRDLDRGVGFLPHTHFLFFPSPGLSLLFPFAIPLAR
jgi:hypothetical protein